MFKTPVLSRGIDCDATRWITLPAAMSVMEATRWAWLCDPELGLIEELHQGHGFIVTEQRASFTRRFGIGVPCVCTAQLTHVGRVEARAYQQLMSVDGELLAHSLVRGAWINAEGRLTRIPRALRSAVEHLDLSEIFSEISSRTSERDPRDAHPARETSLLTPRSPLRCGRLEWDQELKSPPTHPIRQHITTVHVRESDCDMFRHVNASVYVRYFTDALAAQGHPSSVDRAWVSYEGQARAQDVLELRSSDLGADVWRFELSRDTVRLVSALIEVSPK